MSLTNDFSVPLEEKVYALGDLKEDKKTEYVELKQNDRYYDMIGNLVRLNQLEVLRNHYLTKVLDL